MKQESNYRFQNIDWQKVIYIIVKAIVFIFIFAVLHYLYTLSPNPFFQAISGKDESVFQHLKMGYFGYLILIAIEFIVRRKKIENKGSFLFSRLLTSLLIPWIIFVIWYIAPAFVGAPLSLAWELTWAFAVVFITGILGAVIDENTGKLKFTISVQVIIIGLVLISIFIFIWFSFIDPWIDVFILPEH